MDIARKKVMLSLNGETSRSGYLNLDPLAALDDPLKTRADLACLDDYIDDAEADEIVAYDVVDYMPANELNNIFDNWVRKIRHGGKICIQGVDMREVAKAIVRQELTVDAANIILYGAQRAPWEYRKASLTMQKILEILESRGFKIIHKRVVNYSYNVVAERP